MNPQSQTAGQFEFKQLAARVGPDALQGGHCGGCDGCSGCSHGT